MKIERMNLKALKEKMEELKGRVFVLNFWATWCPPCVKEIPGFVKVYQENKEKGLEIIGISVEEDEEKVKAKADELKIDYPIYLGDEEIGKEYKIQFIPTTFFYGKDGNLAHQHTGFLSKEEFEEKLKTLLSVSPQN